ncbi:HD domain-containing protein [Aquimarina rhabdastrellae]
MIVKTAQYCSELLKKSRCRLYAFHNLNHTREVVENVKEISKWQNISDNHTEMIQIAAWFHDTGFSEVYTGHEEASKKIATRFLEKHKFDQNKIEIICNLIDATKMPQTPKNEYEQILCDADLMHISTPNFFYKKLFLRREWELFCDLKMSDIEWHKTNADFLRTHSFKTDYGKKVLEIRKQDNLKKINEILKYFH